MVWFLPHHGGGGSGVVLWLGGGTGWQRDITSSLLPIERLVLGDDSLLHAVLKHRHEQLDRTEDGLMNLDCGPEAGPLCLLRTVYLVVWFGVVVQGQDVVQEDIKLWRHVFEQHPMVVTLFNLTDLFLEKTPKITFSCSFFFTALKYETGDAHQNISQQDPLGTG